MHIAILGAGNVGSTLGTIWAAKGHTIRFGVRNPSDPKYQHLTDKVDGDARAVAIREASRDADVVVIAVPWPAVPDTLRAAGDLAGKVLIDCTNPLQPDLKALTIGHSTSAGEQIAKWAPTAHVVKCFNTTGWANMAEPTIQDIRLTMPLCGNDADAKRRVATLVEEVGFEPIDVGPLVQARLLEPLAMLWIYLAVHRSFGSDFAWQLLKR